jgi:hypothetical protein
MVGGNFFAGIGLGTVIILWLYDKLLLRKK